MSASPTRSIPPRPPLPEKSSTQSRYSSDTIFSHKSSSSTAKTSEPTHTRRSSAASHHNTTIAPSLSHSSANKDVVVHSIQAFGPTTTNSVTHSPAAASLARKRSRDLLLDSFPFPPCSPVIEGNDDEARDDQYQTLRIVRDTEEDSEDVISEMPQFPMPPERTLSYGSRAASPNVSLNKSHQEKDTIIAATIRVSVPEKRSFFSRSHSYHTPPTKYVTISMPLSEYNRHFAYDLETRAYVGTQSYRLWSLEEVESRYSKYRVDNTPASAAKPTMKSTSSTTTIGSLGSGVVIGSFARKTSGETIRSQRSTSNLGNHMNGGVGAPMGLVRPMTPSSIVSKSSGLGIQISADRDKEKRSFMGLRRMTSNMSLRPQSSRGSVHTNDSVYTSTSRRASIEQVEEEIQIKAVPANNDTTTSKHGSHPTSVTSSTINTLSMSTGSSTNTLTPESTRSTVTVTTGRAPSTPMVTRLSPTPTTISTFSSTRSHERSSQSDNLSRDATSSNRSSSYTTTSSRNTKEESKRSKEESKKSKSSRDKDSHKDKLSGMKLKNGSTLRSGVGDGMYGIVLSDKNPSALSDSKSKGKNKGKDKDSGSSSGKMSRSERDRDGRDRYKDRKEEIIDEDDPPWSTKPEESGRLEIWVTTSVVVESVRIDVGNVESTGSDVWGGAVGSGGAANY